MHHRIHTTTQLLCQLQIGQVSLHKLRAALDQRRHRISAPPVDADTQALLQRKAGKTPTDKTTGSGYQNLPGRSRWMIKSGVSNPRRTPS